MRSSDLFPARQQRPGEVWAAAMPWTALWKHKFQWFLSPDPFVPSTAVHLEFYKPALKSAVRASSASGWFTQEPWTSPQFCPELSTNNWRHFGAPTEEEEFFNVQTAQAWYWLWQWEQKTVSCNGIKVSRGLSTYMKYLVTKVPVVILIAEPSSELHSALPTEGELPGPNSSRIHPPQLKNWRSRSV